MERFRLIVAIVVTLVWAGVYTNSIVNPAFHAPPEISGVMLAVVTWLFGAEIKQRIGKGNDEA